MIAERILHTFVGLHRAATKVSPQDLYQLHTNDDGTTAVARDGSLVSFIECNGVQQMKGGEERDSLLENLTTTFNTYVNQPGYQIEVVYGAMPELAADRVRHFLASARMTARRSHLDLSDLFDERERTLPGRLVPEVCLLVLWTRPSVLSKPDLKRARQRQKIRSRNAAAVGRSQMPELALDVLRTRHRAFVSGVLGDINRNGLLGNLLDINDALVLQRQLIEPDAPVDGLNGQAGWRPRLLWQTPGARDYGPGVQEDLVTLGEISVPPLRPGHVVLDPEGTLREWLNARFANWQPARRSEPAPRFLSAASTAEISVRDTSTSGAQKSFAQPKRTAAPASTGKRTTRAKTKTASTTPSKRTRNQGKKPPTKRESQEVRSLEQALPPALQEQLVRRDAEHVSSEIIRYGAHYWGVVDMVLLPEKFQPFNELLLRLGQTGERFPWRVRFLLEGGGQHAFFWKKITARLLAWAGDDNKRIKQIADDLHAYMLDNGSVGRLRITFSTYAKDEETVESRLNYLQRAVEGWGTAAVDTMVGDPLETLFATHPGVTSGSTAPPALLPVEKAMRLMPWDRPGTVWKDGPVLFRTPDGRPWPYTPGSSKQTTWVDVVYGPPGLGKSVLMQTLNLATCLGPRLDPKDASLPYVGIIDIGTSSAGLIDVLHHALPQDLRYQVQYRRLQNTKSYAINPFETPLGMRYPTAHEHAFLVNFLTLLATPGDRRNPNTGMTMPYDGITDLVASVITEMYRQTSDEGQPKRYAPNIDMEVDAALADYDIQLPADRPTWWEVTDALAAAGRYHEARLAQRHAVPLLSEAQVAVRANAITSLYQEARTSTQETLPAIFGRLISTAVTEYPILAYPSEFDLGGARVVSLDLNDVAKRGGPVADKQTSLMYILARYVLGRNMFALPPEEIPRDAAPYYRQYHRERHEAVRSTPKRFVYDEYHRTSRSHAVREQTIEDMREGRKWGIQIMLASQMISDFDSEMIEMATTRWICGVGSDTGVDKAQETFALNQAERKVLTRDLKGPGPDGAPFYVIMDTRTGQYRQHLVNQLGPIELWAFQTDPNDTLLRDKVYQRLGPQLARQTLAKMFPSGSAQKEISHRLASAHAELGEEAETGIIDGIVEDLVQVAGR